MQKPVVPILMVVTACKKNSLQWTDVMLKQRRPLLLVLRESPLSLIHCRNMVTVTEAGAIVQPASPSFYSGPGSVEELIDTVVCRSLDLLGIDNSLMPRWTGREIGS